MISISKIGHILLSRRNFIKHAGLGFAGLSMSCKERLIDTQTRKSVIIIGAGISGLAATQKLKQNGFLVTVVESQDKVGGRIRTNRTLGVPFDEGASWIHGVNGNPLIDLASQAGAASIFIDNSDIIVYDIGGAKYSQNTFAKAEDDFYTILEKLSERGSVNQSFEEVYQSSYPKLAGNRIYQFLASSYLTFDTGDLDKLSSLFYYEGELYDDSEKMITNGYDCIPEFLAKEIDIQLNERVVKVDYSGQKVIVSTKSKVYQADYAVVTVPLGVLKKGVISFTPQLPAFKQNAIEKIGMNSVNKFFVQWHKQFWDENAFIFYTPKVKDKYNFFVNTNRLRPNTNALMTFAYAQAARDSEAQTDEQVINEIMLHLRDIYGSDIPGPSSFLRTKWFSNPDSYGSYSFTQVGMTSMNQFDDLASSIDNRLFFAGEHTHKDFFSTVHGAYLSGIREADKIIDLQ